MKSTFFAMLLALLLLFTGLATLAGIGIMITDLYVGGDKFFEGFQVFCLSATLFFVATIAYIVSKIEASTNVIVDTLTRFVEHEIGKTVSPLQALFGGLGGTGFSGFPQTTIKIGSLDEEGNITPLDEKQFNSKEDFLNYRDNILAKAFGQKPADIKKKFEDMTIKELEAEKEKAVSAQNFELAATLLNLIHEKKKS